MILPKIKIRVFIILAYVFCLSLLQAQSDAELKKIRFKGNISVSNSQLQDAISLKKSKRSDKSFFSNSVYKQDVTKVIELYQRFGFLNAEVADAELKYSRKGKVSVTFNVKENDQIRVGDVQFRINGSQSLDEFFATYKSRKLIKTLSARKGKVFRDAAVYEDDVLISQSFENIGYAYVKVEPIIDVDVENKLASIIWEVDTRDLCFFGDITFIGQTKVRQKILDKQVVFDKGDIYNPRKIELTQHNLYNIGVYRIASTKTVRSEEQRDSIATLVNLREAPRLTSKWGAGYGKETNVRVFGQFTYLHFLGGARRAELNMNHSAIEPYDFKLNLIQPSFYSPKSQLILSPYISKENEQGYSLEKKGASITILQKISKRSNMSLGYLNEKVDLDTTSVGDIPDASELQSAYNKAGLTFGFTYTNTQPIFDPIGGIYLAANVKTNDFFKKGPYSFNKFLGEFHKYHLLKYGWVLALKLKAGTILTNSSTEFIPIEERYFGGGSQSIRGYNRQDIGPQDANGQPIGGNTIFEMSIENRILLLPRYGVGMVLFMDLGNVWEQSSYFDAKDLLYSAGVGLRYSTPIGPIGIDLAKPIIKDTGKPWQFYFSIGHSF